MAKIDLLVGTTLGSAEYVADELAERLNAIGHETRLHLAAQLTDLDPGHLWLIVSSTHGAGDLPENIQPLHETICREHPDLSATRYALCAIGDSSYDTFCQGPEMLVKALEDCGAQAHVDKIRIDVQQDPIPEEPALAWLELWLNSL